MTSPDRARYSASVRRILPSGLDVWLLAAIAVHVVVRAWYADFVPLYDSRQYFDECLVPAALGPFELRKLDCFGHTTWLFMGLVLLVQQLDFGSAALLHATTTALGIASVVAFARLCTRFAPAPELTWERRGLVACYALGPVCLSGGVNFSPDYGVLAFFLLMLERLLAGRFLMTALWGACLSFSKETGLLLYVAAVGSFALHAWVRPNAWPAGRELVRTGALSTLPVVALGVYKALDVLAGKPALWGGERTGHVLLPMFLSFELLEPTFVAYAFDVLALGFNWILGLPLLLFTAIAAARAVAARSPLPAHGFDGRAARVVLTLALLSFVLLTRFRTVNNVRYLFALNPLFLLAACYALSALGLRMSLRRALLGLALVLTFSFNFHSVDPISQRFFGTFAFGRHALLRGATFDVCCGYGRDQIVYNLQFTQLHYLQNQAYRELRPGKGSVLVANKQATVQLARRVDTRFERTLRVGEGVTEVQIYGVTELLAQSPPPDRIHFMALPNFDNTSAYGKLLARYQHVGTRVFRRGDYELPVHVLQRKP